MGGLDRLGPIATGDEYAAIRAARRALQDAPAILAADCTLPHDTDWRNIRAAIAAAHRSKTG
jgi:uroporphyrinogen decarboxylase